MGCNKNTQEIEISGSICNVRHVSTASFPASCDSCHNQSKMLMLAYPPKLKAPAKQGRKTGRGDDFCRSSRQAFPLSLYISFPWKQVKSRKSHLAQRYVTQNQRELCGLKFYLSLPKMLSYVTQKFSKECMLNISCSKERDLVLRY